METIQVHNNPNLDARMVMQVLSENLDSKYEIFSISSMWREIMIRQNYILFHVKLFLSHNSINYV